MERELSARRFFDLAPLAPVSLAFGAGIMAGGFFPLSPHVLYAIVVLGFVFPVLAFFLRHGFSFIVITPVFFFLGLLFIAPYGPGLMPPGHITTAIKEAGPDERSSGKGAKGAGSLYDVTGVVTGEAEFRGRYTRFIVSTRSISSGGHRQVARGGVRLSVRGRVEGIGTGDYVRFLGYLKRPHNFGNPGELNYVRWLRGRGVEALGYVRSPAWVIRFGRGGTYGQGARGLAERARKGINNFIDASGAAHPEILKALVTGERSGIGAKTRRAFSRAGAAHVLAISGLHVGIVAFFTYFIFVSLLKRSAFLALRLNIKKTALLMSLVPVLAYGFMAGFSRPTERAVIMAAAFIFSVLMDRGRSYYNTLALAGLIILATAPASIFEASFQLSFLAVFFILYLTPVFQAFLRGFARKEPDQFGDLSGASRLRALSSWLRRRGTDLVAVTMAASLGTWPAVAYHFGSISTVGLFTNMLVLPLTTFMVEALFISSTLIPISATLAGWGFHLAGYASHAMLGVVGAFSASGLSSLHLSRPAPVEVFFIYLFIFALFGLKRARLFRVMIPLSAVAILVLVAYPGVEAGLNPRLKVTFISVGQGDASLIEFPGGHVMLIDGGGFGGGEGAFDTGRGIIAPLLRYKKIRRIDYMVLSHAQNDHMGGLKYLAGNFPVGEFWWNGRGRLGELGKRLAGAGVPLRTLGRKRRSFMVEGARIEVLPTPPETEAGLNDRSLVVRLTYGARTFLFTGDIEAPAEAYLAGLGNMGADVLKAPHHGSRTSSSMGFLRTLRPRLVVISLGRGNRFGFPSARSLSNYRKVGARVLRTDFDGAVEVSTDGEGLFVKTYGG